MAVTFTPGFTWANANTVTPTRLNSAITSMVLSQATGRLLGRTTASAGTTEEITPGAGLELATLGLAVGWLDTNSSHRMRVACGSDLTADRTITITPGDSDRTITLSGNPTLADWFDQSVKSGASPTFTATNFSGSSGITGVGALTSGSIAAGFGSIDIGADSLTAGAGNFSSTVTSTMSGKLFERTGASTGIEYFRLANTGGTLYVGLEGSAAGGIVSGDSAYDAYFATASATGISIGINSAQVGRFTSTGLSVTGTLGASGNVWGQTATVDVTTGTADGFTSYSSDNTFHISRNGGGSLFLRRRSSDGTLAGFYRDTTNVGSISVTTTATAYNTSSDARLKTNVRPLTGSGAIIDALKPSLFDWKSGEKDSYGFIAQEVHPIFPQAVTKGDDDPDTITAQWAMDASKFMPLAIAELKSLRARVAELEAA